MRQLTTNELTNIAGGSDALFVMGVIGLTALTIGLVSTIPVRQPICTQTSTPVFDPYTGVYMGDMVDTYCY